MKNNNTNKILVGMTILSVFSLIGFKLTTKDVITRTPAFAAVPGVSCSGAMFGTNDTADTSDITAGQFIGRFPAPSIVTGYTGSKIYGDGTPSTENLKYGSSGAKGTFTLTLSENVTGVKMGLKVWSGDTANVVIVNGTEFAVPIGQSYTDNLWTFDVPTNTITFSAKNASKNRGFISYISFYY